MDTLAALHQIPLFSGMNEEEVAALYALMKQHTYVPGQVIIREGERGDSFHTILQGKAQVLTQDGRGHEIQLADLNPGDFFGEVSLLTGEPRSARIRAVVQVTTLALDQQSFFEFLQSHSHAAVAVLVVLGQRLHHTDSMLRLTTRSANEIADERMTFGEHIADTWATMMGSWGFIGIQTLVFVVYVIWNIIGGLKHWDPYPFLLLSMILNFQAAYTGPIIMMSQNRQAMKDRVTITNNHEVNTRAAVEVGLILQRLDDIEQILHRPASIRFSDSGAVALDDIPGKIEV